MFRFFRFIRRHTRPLEYSTAYKWDRRLNLMYIFFAWNALGAAAYCYFSSGANKERKNDRYSAQSWAEYLNLEKVSVIKLQGMKGYDTFEVENSTLQETANADSNEV